jgi:hypothetical protein
MGTAFPIPEHASVIVGWVPRIRPCQNTTAAEFLPIKRWGRCAFPSRRSRARKLETPSPYPGPSRGQRGASGIEVARPWHRAREGAKEPVNDPCVNTRRRIHGAQERRRGKSTAFPGTRPSGRGSEAASSLRGWQIGCSRGLASPICQDPLDGHACVPGNAVDFPRRLLLLVAENGGLPLPGAMECLRKVIRNNGLKSSKQSEALH